MAQYALSDTLAYALRHKPSILGITVSPQGWANVNDALNGLIQLGHMIKPSDFLILIQQDKKKRFSFNRDFTQIRANYGHSLPVKLELAQKTPPLLLYHGTTVAHINAIMQSGEISKMQREYVHLSLDEDTAKKVALRHGTPHIVTVCAQAMHENGYNFYLAPNNVWLTESIPISYIMY